MANDTQTAGAWSMSDDERCADGEHIFDPAERLGRCRLCWEPDPQRVNAASDAADRLVAALVDAAQHDVVEWSYEHGAQPWADYEIDQRVGVHLGLYGDAAEANVVSKAGVHWPYPAAELRHGEHVCTWCGEPLKPPRRLGDPDKWRHVNEPKARERRMEAERERNRQTIARAVTVRVQQRHQ